MAVWLHCFPCGVLLVLVVLVLTPHKGEGAIGGGGTVPCNAFEAQHRARGHPGHAHKVREWVGEGVLAHAACKSVWPPRTRTRLRLWLQNQREGGAWGGERRDGE